ncbi:MAG: leucyl aminopeptidase [Candidatus Sericytochromatia bacterium]|nr:leucyl aminopeptidase [Candidatus Sericytochromatia bacterium]
MQVEVVCKKLEEVKTQALVLTVFEGEKDNIEKFVGLDEKLRNKIMKLIDTKEVSGKFKEFTILHTDELSAERVLVMGLGKRKDFNLERLRAVMAISARNIRRINLSEMAIAEGFNDLGIAYQDSASAIIEGIVLGLYRFKKHVSDHKDDSKAIKNLIIAVQNEDVKAEIEKGTYKGFTLSNATNFVRDLVNEPANFMTATIFADEAKKMADANGIEITILGKEEIEKIGMHALLAVNAGSKEPPRFVLMEYKGKEGGKTLGLVGKGVTFDSGGLSLKPSDAMLGMHTDMAGGAAVLGAMQCIAQQKLPINVIAAIPLTDNLVDSTSYKVGDIIGSLEGKTIEVLNTDAEGRLILADALTYIRRHKPLDYLVDIATLTGAIIVALGHFCSGAMTTNQEFFEVAKAAGEKTGERIWQLPLFDEYKSQIRSSSADLENIGGRAAGSITAAIFLKEFVGEVPWIHLDIAGTATMDESIMTYAKNPFLPKKGATGVGTRLLYQLAESLSEQK